MSGGFAGLEPRSDIDVVEEWYCRDREQYQRVP